MKNYTSATTCISNYAEPEKLQLIANQKIVNQGKLARQIILDDLECQKINYPAA
jgi:hypothetical protein